MRPIPTQLSPGYKESPIWWEVLDGLPYTPLGTRVEADVVVVGGGYTGLAAAGELASQGRSVVVLEAERLGYGGSGRNAGIVHPGLNRSLHVARHRKDARRLYQETNDAFALVEELITRHGIDCDYEPNGRATLAHHPAVAARMPLQRDIFRDVLGDEVSFVSRVELGTELRSPAFFGGLVFPISGTLHPVKYLLGLAQRTTAQGAQIFVSSPAQRIARNQNGLSTVSTPDGKVIARDVIIATDAYTGKIVPRLGRRVIPINSYVVATEELEAADVSDVSRKGRAFTDSRNFLSYWRLWGKRLVFGGRTSFRELSLSEARDALYARILSFYPQLEGVRINYAWQGKVGFTFDRLPHMARIGGVTFAGGYCGSGIALATYFGIQAARQLMGAPRSEYARLRFPTIPGYTGTPWFLPIAGLFYRLKDMRP